MAFLPNPQELPCVNHIDCVRDHNSVSNLEWCTQQENLWHSQRLGRMQRDYWAGRRSPTAALSDDAAEKIRSDYARGGVSWAQLAARYGTNKRTVGRILSGGSYVRAQVA
jgi:ribosome-binding protein aMBF1 (putative translation factor)